MTYMGFPDSSVDKESACNARDPSSIPGLGRSPGEGIGYPLQYSWASLVAQLVKNPPTMQETWVQSLGWEDPLRRERLLTPVFWPGGGRKEWDTTEWLLLSWGTHYESQCVRGAEQEKSLKLNLIKETHSKKPRLFIDSLKGLSNQKEG